jgi:phosphatidylserine/phosphatidylglycerophosphate/cardiolipin synthase-like enzyme
MTPSRSRAESISRSTDGTRPGTTTIQPGGTQSGPVHDLHMAVDGAAAGALGEVARSRWRLATGDALEPVRVDQEAWPADLEPDFRRVPVAIARTAPLWGDQPAIEEAAALAADALAAARRTIYIEAQYLVSFTLGDLLAGHLADPAGPEIVIVAGRVLRGAFERFAMGSNRDRLIRRMKQADRFDRLRICYPVVPATDGEREVLVHSKLIIVDDRFLRVGSSNINNRSVGLDTECDLAIEAENEVERQSIARVRERLLAEHLGVGPERVAEAVASDRRAPARGTPCRASVSAGGPAG